MPIRRCSRRMTTGLWSSTRLISDARSAPANWTMPHTSMASIKFANSVTRRWTTNTAAHATKLSGVAQWPSGTNTITIGASDARGAILNWKILWQRISRMTHTAKCATQRTPKTSAHTASAVIGAGTSLVCWARGGVRTTFSATFAMSQWSKCSSTIETRKFLKFKCQGPGQIC